MMAESYAVLYDKISFKALIFVVALAYFSLSFYWVISSIRWQYLMISEYSFFAAEILKDPVWTVIFYAAEVTAGPISVYSRGVAGFLALYSAFIFFRKGKGVLSQIRGKIGAALAFESGYFLALIPSVVEMVYLFFESGRVWYFGEINGLVALVVGGIPCFVMIVTVPYVLLKLRSKIVHNAPTQEIVKWSCIVGVTYLYVVFWFTYTMTWLGTLIPWPARAQPGIEILWNPLALTSFVVTVVGLFLIATYGLITTLPAIKKSPTELNLRKVGIVMTALGGYFVFMLALYFLSGGYSAQPTAWMEIIGPHNADMWCISFLALGLLLLTIKNKVKG
jgi:hypothetical protein